MGVDLRTAHVGEHLIRSLAGLASMYCYFFAIGHMRLADAVLLNYSLPLFMPRRVAWLREPFPGGSGAVVVGFARIALILKPGLELYNPVALVGLA